MLKQLTPTLWQANAEDARKLCQTERWKDLGLKGVICPAFNVRIPYDKELAALILPVWDDRPVPPEYFDMAVEFHKKFSPTLVHCFGGINRSSAFALALMYKEGISIEAGYNKVNAKPWGEPLLESLHRWAAANK
jgi:protein-tyrosine phosphatase